MNTIEECDLAVVGGGLHGVSIAAEAASRGLSVILLQGKDLASGPTGSLRSVLRGGLRKLEQFQFARVNSNLREIAHLKVKAPHLLTLHDFTLHAPRNAQLSKRLRFATKTYRYLQQRQLKKAGVDSAFKDETPHTQYHEYQLNNVRLILALALHAKQFGASIRPHQRVIAAERNTTDWMLTIANKPNNAHYQIRAKTLVNCCGWLANEFLHDVLDVNTRCRAQVQHYAQLVLRKPENYPGGTVCQLHNGRLLYAHSLDDKHFILGPLFINDDNDAVKQAAVESALQTWNDTTATNLNQHAIVNIWWAARARPEDPLSNDASNFRESLLDLNNPGKCAPLLSMFGMNTVAHRLIAEQALEILQPFTQTKQNKQFHTQALSGGHFPNGLNAYLAHYASKTKAELHTTVERLIRHYGTLSEPLLDRLITQTQGKHFGHGLYQAEVDYLLDEEWASCADDILWRRSGLGLYFSAAETVALDEWICENRR